MAARYRRSRWRGSCVTLRFPGPSTTSTATRSPATAAGRSSIPGSGRRGTVRAGTRRSPRSARGRSQRIVVTHYHPDHIGGERALAELTGAGRSFGGRPSRPARGWRDERDLEALERYFLGHGMPAGARLRIRLRRGGLPVGAPTDASCRGRRLVELGGEAFRSSSSPVTPTGTSPSSVSGPGGSSAAT